MVKGSRTTANLPPPMRRIVLAGPSKTTGRIAMVRLGRLALLMTLAAVLPAAADDYPDKPIRAIASQGAGGLSDVFMRALADQLGPELGGTVLVENRVGAAGSIGARACADSEPDGYTICIINNELMVINTLIFKKQIFTTKTSLSPHTRA